MVKRWLRSRCALGGLISLLFSGATKHHLSPLLGCRKDLLLPHMFSVVKLQIWILPQQHWYNCLLLLCICEVDVGFMRVKMLSSGVNLARNSSNKCITPLSPQVWETEQNPSKMPLNCFGGHSKSEAGVWHLAFAYIVMCCCCAPLLS